MRIAVAGSTGLIGSALVPVLETAGHEVVRLVRPQTGASGIAWDPEIGTIDAGGLAGVDAVVNLAGRSIGERRWTDAEREVVLTSRVDSTRLLAETLAGMAGGPRVLINASAIGYYGDRPGERLAETSGPGTGFFPEVCLEWESATAPATAAGLRVVLLRTGIVLSPEGGALGRTLAPLGPAWLSPYRWGLGGWIGDGEGVWSWISLDDAVAAIVHLLGSDRSGPVNLSAPEPVPNKRFLKAVGKALGRPVWLPIPRFILSLLLGRRLAEATLYGSAHVCPDVLEADGFEFGHRVIEPAMAEALAR